MFSGQLLCFLLALLVCCSTNTGAETITVSSGDSVFLPCPLVFKHSNRTRVEWKKDGRSLCIYFIKHTKIDVFKCKPQFKVNTEPSGLNITGVESSDAGVYTYLTNKLIPPPTENNSTTVRLKVKVAPSLTLQLMNSTNSFCVELLCSLQGLEPQQVNFTWIRAAQLLHHHESSNMSSFLKLCKPNWTEGETLTCRALYSINHTLYMKSITLQKGSISTDIFTGSAVRFIVTGTLLGLMIGTALFIEVYYQCRIVRGGQSTADGNDIS
ncbi:hypothetical protein KOW79_013712 [Hemibagrus wyckioides]|uniref:Ig-like domain-containing protein n=2 Tax=Hemibagrus wyckioides TaxID=337641 RepID=A0A9D3NGP9_9TELE|nr:hypothetical protein KOW79_013712 [Hemibagrus wyckioides]